MSGHTYTHTYTQDNYSNPRCACAPRVNNPQCAWGLKARRHCVAGYECRRCNNIQREEQLEVDKELELDELVLQVDKEELEQDEEDEYDSVDSRDELQNAEWNCHIQILNTAAYILMTQSHSYILILFLTNIHIRTTSMYSLLLYISDFMCKKWNTSVLQLIQATFTSGYM